MSYTQALWATNSHFWVALFKSSTEKAHLFHYGDKSVFCDVFLLETENQTGKALALGKKKNLVINMC